MAKKTRPTFSAPPDKATPQAGGSQWVYRSDPAPAIAAKTAPPARSSSVVNAARSSSAATAARSSSVVNCAALLLWPVALVTGLVLEPLTACWLRKPWRARSG